jgi:hypothetical protein
MFKAMPRSILHPILVHVLKIRKNKGSQMGQTDQIIIIIIIIIGGAKKHVDLL